MTKPLSERLRPNVEAAPWVIAAIIEQELVITGLHQQLVAFNHNRKAAYQRHKEVRTKLVQQLAAALAACKVKDEALRTWVKCCELSATIRTEVAIPLKALAIQSDEAALKAWIGEPVAIADGSDSGIMWLVAVEDGTQLYAPKEQPK